MVYCHRCIKSYLYYVANDFILPFISICFKFFNVMLQVLFVSLCLKEMCGDADDADDGGDSGVDVFVSYLFNLFTCLVDGLAGITCLILTSLLYFLLIRSILPCLYSFPLFCPFADLHFTFLTSLQHHPCSRQ